MSLEKEEYPKFSVLVATYNRIDMLLRCLKSILEQDYYNIEIVISDDCSTDNTAKVIGELISAEPRVKYFRNTQNLGPVENSKKMMTYATGDYSMFLCDDDYMIGSDYFSHAAKNIVDNKDILMVVGETEVVDEIKCCNQIAKLASYGVFKEIDYLLSHKSISPNFGTALIKTDVLERVYLAVSSSNWESGLEIMLRIYYEGYVAHLPVLAAAWVCHEAGTGYAATSKDPKIYIRAIDCYWKPYKDYRNDETLSDDDKRHLEKYYLLNPIYDYIKLLYGHKITSWSEIYSLFSDRDVDLGVYLNGVFEKNNKKRFDLTLPFMIYGAGVAGREVLQVLQSAGYKVDTFIDDAVSGELYSIAIVPFEHLNFTNVNVVIGIDDDEIVLRKREALEQKGYKHIASFNEYVFELLN